MEKIIYLDNAATTKVFDEVFDLQRENNSCFYNPSATYNAGIEAKRKLDEARAKITSLLHGIGGKLYFTSSATESNNTILFGLHIRPGQTVLVSKAEHPSVYVTAHELTKRGIKVIDIPLKSNGLVDENAFEGLLKSNDVALVSVIHVSNETGAVNDIKKLSKIAKKFNPKIIFHSDGVQAFGKINVDLNDLGVDLYTISAHKIYSVRGIAGLWIKSGVVVDPLLYGGGQELGIRSSTENVAGAVAFAWCADKVCFDIEENTERVWKVRKELILKLEKSSISNYFTVNEAENQSPYILSISFSDLKGEVLMNSLQADGVIVSTGSACSSKKAGNRTLEAMGLGKEKVIGSVRVSFSAYEDYDIDRICLSFEKNVLRLIKNKKR